jgi:LmeA-like phospholipid-binding
VLLRRLIRVLLPIALLLAAIYVLFRFVAVPYAESQAADAISNDLGADVTVHADPPLRPGLLSGDLGDLVVKSDELERQGIVVNDVRARIHDAHASLGDLFGGTVRVRFSKIDLRGRVGEATLAKYLRDHFASADIKGTNRLTVDVKPGVLVAHLPKGDVPLHVAVSGPTTLRLSPAIGGILGRLVGNALSTGIDLAPLPYGLRLRTVRLVEGAALVTAGRGPGTETLQS